MHALLDAMDRGLGEGETAIFPINILKVKRGINFSDNDFNLAINNIEEALRGELEYETPNFDLFVKTCKVSARRLFPNVLNLDAPFNVSEEWDHSKEDNYTNEPAVMG